MPKPADAVQGLESKKREINALGEQPLKFSPNVINLSHSSGIQDVDAFSPMAERLDTFCECTYLRCLGQSLSLGLLAEWTYVPLLWALGHIAMASWRGTLEDLF